MSDSFASRHGLEALCAIAVPASDAGIELRLVADSGFINLRMDARRARAMDAVADILGHGLPVEPNTLAAGTSRSYWLGPDEWLIVTTAVEVRHLVDALEEALAGHHAAVNDLSGGYVRLQLAGDRVRDVLARGATIDLHPREFGPLQCAQTGLAKCAVLIGHLGEPPVMELIVRRSFSDYLLRWLMHSADAVGLAVVDD